LGRNSAPFRKGKTSRGKGKNYLIEKGQKQGRETSGGKTSQRKAVLKRDGPRGYRWMNQNKKDAAKKKERVQ